MKKALLPLVVAAFAVVGFAHSAQAQIQKAAQVGPLTSVACQSTFTSGTPGASYMKFCTTQNGNIAQFQNPDSSFNQLFQGGEGYGVCDQTNKVNVRYYDWGSYGSSGWEDATIIQPNGPNTFPLTITRTTSDGVFTLKQAFSRNTTTPSVKITMTLTNNSGMSRQVVLERLADIDADGETFKNRFDNLIYSAWGYSGTLDYAGLHGLMMRPTSQKGFAYAEIVLAGSKDPCNMSPQHTLFVGDGATVLNWVFDAGPQTSTTLSFEYRPM